MTNRAEAAAVPASFTLDGVEYSMSPLTDEIVGRLDNWLRTSVIRMGRAAAREETFVDDRDAIMAAAFQVARRTSWFTEGDAMARTLGGAARVLYETTRGNNPNATVEKFVTGIRNHTAGLTEAWDVFHMLNPGRQSKKKATEPTTTEATEPTSAKATSTKPSAPDTDGPPTS